MFYLWKSVKCCWVKTRLKQSDMEFGDFVKKTPRSHEKHFKSINTFAYAFIIPKRWLREKKDTISISIIKWRLFVQSRISFIQKRFVLSFVEYGPVVLEKKVKMKKGVAPHSNNRGFPSLIIKDSFGKFGWNWTGGFGEQDENVFMMMLTHRKTTTKNGQVSIR